jgi:hypothetical protein
MRALPLALLGFAVVVGTAALIRHGMRRDAAHTAGLRRQLLAQRRPPCTATVDFHDMGELPPVVQRYFRTVLREGQPIVSGAHIQHRGSFRMTLESGRWLPFLSDQVVTMQPPGFDWHARISLGPGIELQVHDTYIAGLGILDAKLFGRFSLAHQQDSDALAEGELMRFLAEAVWYPTALLPSQGVQWQAVDADSALAILADGHARVALYFMFDDDGLVSRVRAQSRGRSVGGRIVPTPWQGRFDEYRVFNGMLLPSAGEVAWILDEDEKTYWRGRVTSIEHEV